MIIKITSSIVFLMQQNPCDYVFQLELVEVIVHGQIHNGTYARFTYH